MQLVAFCSLKILNRNSGASGAIWCLLVLSGTIWACLWLSGAIWSNVRLTSTIWCYLRHLLPSGAFWCWGIRAHRSLSGAIWGSLGLAGAIWCYRKLSGAIWGYLLLPGASGAIWCLLVLCSCHSSAIRAHDCHLCIFFIFNAAGDTRHCSLFLRLNYVLHIHFRQGPQTL